MTSNQLTALPVHASPETDPRARGRGLGSAQRTAVRFAATGYLQLFAAHGLGESRVRELGEQALAATAGWAPRLAEEMRGIAEGAELPLWQVGALNGRTEILAAAAVEGGGEGPGECSTSVVLPADGGPPRTVQTWDWRDLLRPAMLGWTLEPTPGHRVAMLTEAGIVGKIGMNGAGLGVHFNVLRHAGDRAEVGVPVHVVARRILDEADTVAAATELARSAAVSASTVVTVVTRDAARCLELSPDGPGVVDPPADGHLVHTNHFLDPALVPGERVDPDSTTWQRLRWLRGHRTQLAAADRTERARGLCAHAADGAAVCAHADPTQPAHERVQSLATVVLDVEARAVHLTPGGPCAVHPDGWQLLSAA